jgi:hypothetical protein
MKKKLDAWASKVLDRVSDYVAEHRGVPIMAGVALVIVSLLLRLIPNEPGWLLAISDLLLYLGIIVGFVGVLLGDAL